MRSFNDNCSWTRKLPYDLQLTVATVADSRIIEKEHLQNVILDILGEIIKIRGTFERTSYTRGTFERISISIVRYFWRATLGLSPAAIFRLV